MTEDEQDRLCVERCLQGEAEAFGGILDRYERPVYNLVVRLGADREEARDICQQVFINIYQHLASYDPSRRFFSWLYRAAVNETINHMKSRRSWEPLEGQRVENREPDPEQALQAVEQEREIQRGLLQLEMKYRLAVIAYHFLQLSYEEAAYVLSVPERTVKSRLFTARQQLREILEERRHARR
ncbi:MAG TPA: sigma-70 family RNA polymerase sigma factor [Thermoanaerobaculia bacterium]|nr:sigma-70 family RNA polymerase sigma factor [Thermoanaerobaculia bacterium]